MKTRTFQSLVLTITAVAAVSFLAGNTVAQDSSTATTASQSTPAAAQPAVTTPAAQPAAASQAVPLLSYGVTQVMDLAHAKVPDNTIIAYIRNSGNNYGLDAAQIIYLKQQGVSSDVINAMLNQRTQSAQTTAQTATSQPVSTDTYNTQTATVVAEPSVSYVQTAPPQTVYVIPDTQTYDYYANYPYYYPYYGYYGWPYPAVSFSFGWGGYYGGGYRGGWHGGGGWQHGGGGGQHGGGGWQHGGGWHHH